MNAKLRKLAATNNTLLITGRTGTGKSHLAREVHELSPRRYGRFVPINLATLSENLIESELFGHERGAFSGADSRRVGKMEIASGGTVFLDEIGELPPRIQTKLLEALNSHTVSPVGSNREVVLDVRIITATNRDLAAMVRAGTFREDLFFRINTFQWHMEDLAQTPSRIPELARAFAEAAARAQNRPFAGMEAAFLEALQRYSWPGNVRELKNAMEYAVAMSPGDRLDPDSLPSLVRCGTGTAPVTNLITIPANYREAKTLFERAYLEDMLLRFEGKINLTAKRSGLSKVTLIEKIRRYDINIPKIKYQAHLTAVGRKEETP